MSEQGNIDLSKVIGLIMENPQLIEQISKLAKQNGEYVTEPTSTENQQTEVKTSVEQSIPTYAPRNSSKESRTQLLSALKPYVSQERAKAIDSMISIADILDMMKAR